MENPLEWLHRESIARRVRSRALVENLLLLGAFTFLLVFALPNLGNNLTPRNFMVWGVFALVVTVFALRPRSMLCPTSDMTRKVLLLLGLSAVAILVWWLFGPNSNVPHYPWLAFASAVAFVVMLWALTQPFLTNSSFDRISNVLLVAVLLLCLITLCTPPYSSLGRGWINTFPVEFLLPHGGFQQPNLFASFTAGVYLWALYRFWRVDAEVTQVRLRYGVLGFAMLVIPLTVFLSGSRTGILGLSMGLLGLCGWATVTRRSRATLFWIGLALFLFALAWIFSNYLLSKEIVTARLSDLPAGASTLARVGMWQLGLALWLDSPWFGHGLGSIAQIIDIKSQSPDWTGQSLVGVPNIDHPHNETILWLVETGVFGTLLVVGPFVGVILAVSIWLRGNGLAWLCALLPVVLHTQTEFPLHASAWHWVLLALILASGLVEVRDRTSLTSVVHPTANQKGYEAENLRFANVFDRRTIFWRIPVATIGLLACLFCFHTASVIYKSAMLRSAAYPSVIQMLSATAAGPEMTHPVYGQYARDSWLMFAMPIVLHLDDVDLEQRFCGELQGVYTRWRNPEIKGWMKQCESQR